MRAWLHRLWIRLAHGKGAQITDEAREARYNAEQDIARWGGGSR
jgi:hypothetical protein